MSAPDPGEARASALAHWERAAAGWGRRADELERGAAPVSLWMVEAIDPQPGHVVLELAAGPGETGLLAAELVRPGGRVICTDLAEPMLEVARARAAGRGLRNVEFRRVDAESIDLDAASVDRVLCRWGYMLLLDPAAALRETRRVLRPGGRLALAAWGRAEENPRTSLAARIVRRRLGAPEPGPDEPGMYAFAPPGRIEELLHGTGFVDVRTEALDLVHAYDSFDHWLESSLDLSRWLEDALAALAPREREAALAEVREAFAPYAREGGGLAFPARARVAAARA